MIQAPIRGRPSGQMTIAKRKVLAFVVEKQEAGEAIVWGEMMRACGFSCRANAKRTWDGMVRLGVVDASAVQGRMQRRAVY